MPKDENNIVNMFDTEPTISTEDMLEEAKGHFKDAFVLGYDDEGRLMFSSSNDMTWSDVAFTMQTFLSNLYAGRYHDNE